MRYGVSGRLEVLRRRKDVKLDHMIMIQNNLDVSAGSATWPILHSKGVIVLQGQRCDFDV